MKNRWLSPRWRRATTGYRRLRDSLRARVEERRQKGGNDLFSRLCAESGGAKWIDDDALARYFIGIMVGAFDTTASGTASTGYLLAKHPEWQERMREEALSVGRERISYEGTKRLELADRVWSETLRLYPVSSHLRRRALRDVQLGGWRIPAGTYVLALIGPALHDFHRRFVDSGFVTLLRLGEKALVERDDLVRLQAHRQEFVTAAEAGQMVGHHRSHLPNLERGKRIQSFSLRPEDRRSPRLYRRTEIECLIRELTEKADTQ